MVLEFGFIELAHRLNSRMSGSIHEGSGSVEVARNDCVDDEPESSLAGELEPLLGFTLHLPERIPSREKIRIQVGCS